MNLDAYLGELARCGWWEHSPGGLAEAAQKRIAAWYVAADPGAIPPANLLAALNLDPSAVEAGGLEAFIRHALDELSAASGGLLQAHDVTVILDEEIESVAIAFAAGGRRYRVQAPREDEWFEEGLLDLVNTALEQNGSSLRFHPLPADGEEYPLALVSDQAYECALAAGLFSEDD